jgi:hypothetical protein
MGWAITWCAVREEGHASSPLREMICKGLGARPVLYWHPIYG